MEEEQSINLIIENLPISVQAYILHCSEKKFIPIWEKLGEVEHKNRRNDGQRNEGNRPEKEKNGNLSSQEE